MNPHDLFMPVLNGHEVRHRAAELAPSAAGPHVEPGRTREGRSHFVWLSQQSGIPVGTLQNATRDHNPQVVSLPRVYQLAASLSRPGEDVRDVVAAIVVREDEGVEKAAS